jgi:hypothetical protein
MLVIVFLVCAACTLLAGGSPVRDEAPPDAAAFSPAAGSESLTPDTFRKLAQVLYQRGDREENRMQRKFFYNENITCNDGSPAGYYIRRNLNSKRWIVFLEGKALLPVTPRSADDQLGIGLQVVGFATTRAAAPSAPSSTRIAPRRSAGHGCG